MYKPIHYDQTDGALLQGLPFAGLGFDLAEALQFTALLTLEPVFVLEKKVEWESSAVPVYGYALHVMLGREVRAG